MRKRLFRQGLYTAALLASAAISQAACSDANRSGALETITVYKSPTCGCCSKWVRHLEENGFMVEAIDREDMNTIKTTTKIPRRLASCHTATVGDYVIEGHVPAADIKRLLQERPAVRGLAVPGMPMGSPGMEGPRQDKYDVLTFTQSGDTAVFSQY